MENIEAMIFTSEVLALNGEIMTYNNLEKWFFTIKDNEKYIADSKYITPYKLLVKLKNGQIYILEEIE